MVDPRDTTILFLFVPRMLRLEDCSLFVFALSFPCFQQRAFRIIMMFLRFLYTFSLPGTKLIIYWPLKYCLLGFKSTFTYSCLKVFLKLNDLKVHCRIHYDTSSMPTFLEN